MRDESALAGEQAAQLVDNILERASDLLGDITPHVMARYYAAMPQAMERFEFHHPYKREKLEGEMIEQALYCLMRWHSDRSEIEIILSTTVPHHMFALDIPLELFTGMLDAVFDTIAETIPADADPDRTLWRGLHEALRQQVEESAF